jgi:muramoyltetrapeptide carboxypeptidase
VTLLIDPPNSPGHGRMWSHLASDASYDELHRFAAGLGIPPRGFDRDHYDIPAERYDDVVAAGATPVTSRELITRLKAAGLRRRKAEALAPKQPGRSLIRAERLRPGSRVAVVAPAGPVPGERLDAGLAVLRGWGLEVVVMEHARGSDPVLPYLAAADAARADDLMRAWCDPGIDAVFCTRGGFGVQRMVDLLDWDALAAAGPKVLVGFSDVTALHQTFGARLGLSTIHGPVVAQLGGGDEAMRSHLRTMLFEPDKALALTPDPCAVLVEGRADGVLTGGNVALLAAQVGTPGSRGADGCIAVLEEIGEEPYRLDRLLTQLLRSGWFDGVRGIVVGQLSDCGPEDRVHALLLDRLAPLGVPLVTGAPFGHDQPNLAFPCGVPAELDATDAAPGGTLTLRAPALL